MAGKRYYWLKLHNDFFNSKRIKKLRKLGADYVIIYLKMQLLSLKTNGVLEFTGLENNFADELALELDEDEDKIQLTLSYLQSCGLLECHEDMFFLPYVETCTGSETAVAQRVREYRARQNALQCNTDVTVVKQIGNVEKEIDIEIEKDTEKKKEIDKEKNHIVEIVDYLNLVCKRQFKATTAGTVKYIKARLKEGFKVDDFKTVIDKKASEWLGTNMENYLRPETLFGTKFESYLNQVSTNKTPEGKKWDLPDDFM